MGFSKMVELLQKKNKGYIVFVNCGSFYIARGKDAVILHELLDLKLNCMEVEVCKVGFPINSLEKYCELIEEKKYSYIVYNFDNKIGKLNLIKKYNGKYFNNKDEERLNCYVCKNTVKMYKKEDKYIQAVANLYEEEFDTNKKQDLNSNRNKKTYKFVIKKLKEKGIWKKNQKD